MVRCRRSRLGSVRMMWSRSWRRGRCRLRSRRSRFRSIRMVRSGRCRIRMMVFIVTKCVCAFYDSHCRISKLTHSHICLNTQQALTVRTRPRNLACNTTGYGIRPHRTRRTIIETRHNGTSRIITECLHTGAQRQTIERDRRCNLSIGHFGTGILKLHCHIHGLTAYRGIRIQRQRCRTENGGRVTILNGCARKRRKGKQNK